MPLPESIVQSASKNVLVEVGSSTFDVEEDKPFKATLDKIAHEKIRLVIDPILGMGMAGSYVINADGKILSKSLPATFKGLEKVSLGKYDAGGF